MNKRLALCFLVFGLLLYNFLGAQPWLPEKYKTESPRTINFYELQDAFYRYWSGQLDSLPKGQGYKPFKRWENFWEPRVAPTGNLPAPDINYRAMQDYLAAQANRSTLPSRRPDRGNWKPLGPQHLPQNNTRQPNGMGRVNCIAFHPTDSNTFWIGAAAGGVWKTTDGGKNWQTRTDRLQALGIASIAVHPQKPETLYAATGDKNAYDTYSIGLIYSIDGGENWQLTSLIFNIQQGQLLTLSKVLITPENPDILLVAGDGGIYRSTDAGQSWQRTNAPNLRWVDMEFKPGNANIVYASTRNNRIYRSLDNGQTWSQVNRGLPTNNATRVELAVTPANPEYVYALIADDRSGFRGLYRSTDSGINWEVRSTSDTRGNIPDVGNILNAYHGNPPYIGGQGWYDLALCVSPQNAEDVYVGGINTHRSENGGLNWRMITHWWGRDNTPAVHADIHFLSFGTASSALFNCNDGGVYKSNDNGKTWHNLSGGLVISQFYKIGVSQLEPDYVLAGAQDNGTNAWYQQKWYTILGGDGMECAIDNENTNIVYITYISQIFKLTDTSFTEISEEIRKKETGAWVTPYTLHPSNPRLIYAGYQNIWKSDTRGDSWGALSATNNFINGSFTTLAVAPSDTRYIYAGKNTRNGNRIYRTQNEGRTWEDITSGLPNLAITSITVHPQNPLKIWITLSGYNRGEKVFYSANGGMNWINISGSLPNTPCNTLVYENNSQGAIYVGTDIGVFYKNDTLADWQPFFEGLPNVVVKELEIQDSLQLLRAATYGRGLWETPLYRPCPPPAPEILGKKMICLGDSFTLEASKIWEADFIWRGPYNFNGKGKTIRLVAPQEAGKAVYEVAAVIGSCTSAFTKQEIHFIAPPSLSITTQSALIPNKGSITVNAIGGAPPYQFQLLCPTPRLQNNGEFMELSAGTYRLKVLDQNGCAANATASVAACQPVKNLRILELKPQSALLAWDSIPETNSFTVAYRLAFLSQFQQSSATNNLRLLSPLLPGKEYCARVTTFCQNGSSAQTEQDFIFTTPLNEESCIEPPTLKLKESLSTKAEVFWQAHPNFSSYEVSFRSLASTNWNVLTTSQQNAWLTPLEPGRQYQARLRGFCDRMKASNYSEILTFQTALEPSICPPPVVTQITSAPQKATLIWAPLANSIGFRFGIRLKAEPSLPWHYVNIAGGNIQSREVFNLTPGATYEYAIWNRCPHELSAPALGEFQTLTARSDEQEAQRQPLEEENNRLVAFPNPNTGKFTLFYHSPIAAELKLQIIDSYARNVWENYFSLETGNNEIPLEIDTIKTGVYILKWQNVFENGALKIEVFPR